MADFTRNFTRGELKKLRSKYPRIKESTAVLANFGRRQQGQKKTAEGRQKRIELAHTIRKNTARMGKGDRRLGLALRVYKKPGLHKHLTS